MPINIPASSYLAVTPDTGVPQSGSSPLTADQVLIALKGLEELLPGQPFDKAHARQDDAPWAALTPPASGEADSASHPDGNDNDTKLGSSATSRALRDAESNLRTQAAPYSKDTDAMLDAVGHAVDAELKVRQRISTSIAKLQQNQVDDGVATRMLDEAITDVKTLARQLNMDAIGIANLIPTDAAPPLTPATIVGGAQLDPQMIAILDNADIVRKYMSQYHDAVTVRINAKGEKQPGGGGRAQCWEFDQATDRCTRGVILLEPGHAINRQASTFAHELGHLVFQPDVLSLLHGSRDAFVKAMVYNEGQALFFQQMARRQILAKTGNDIGLLLDDNTEHTETMDKYYDRYVKGEMTMDDACAASARIYRHARPSGTTVTYEQYYGQYWDKNHSG